MHTPPPCKVFQDLEHYLNGPFQATEGWCAGHVWQTLLPLVLAQHALNFSAPVAEVGPYHGKFFWGLVQSTPAIMRHLAIDIFGLEQENADQSGVKGDRALFLGHGRSLGIQESAINLIEKDSLTLTAESIQTQYNTKTPFSFFSVDGAHHPDYVEHDLNLALSLTDRRGIIIVDDYSNPRWHCVQEVVARKYLLSDPEFVPLSFSCNKLFLCHRDFLASYRKVVRDFIMTEFPDTRVYDTDRFGHLGLTILPDMKKNMRVPVYKNTMLEKIRIA